VLGAFAQALERRPADRLAGGVTRDRAERVRVARARQRAQRDDLAARGLGHLRQHPRIGDGIDGVEAVGLRRALERLERQVAQHLEGRAAHALVGIVAGDGAERRRLHQLGDGGAPYARILVLARDRGNRLAVVERQFGDKRQADGRVRMLVTGLGAESVEQRHRGAPAWSL
jgi:hypothetical protein